MEDQRTATVLVLVEAGSKYETKTTNGLSHFLEHMCFKGTTKRPNADIIATELDQLGAEYNAFTGQESTGYYAKVASAYLDTALDIVSDVYLDPLFDIAEIEKEKGVIVGEIDMRNDMLPSRASELFMELLYGDQPAGWPIAGPRAQISTFTRNDLVRYRRSHYVPSATLVVVAGKFDGAKVARAVKARFGSLPALAKKTKKKVIEKQSAPKVLVQHKACDQTHLIVGFRALPLKHPLLPVANVLSMLLGSGMSSRLFRKMRGELGLGYYTNASHSAATDHGAFTVSAGVDNARTDEAIKVIMEELRRITTELVSKEELQKVKDMSAGSIMLGLESSDEIAEFYGFQEAMKREMVSPEEIVRRIKRVTPEDVRSLAQRFFVSRHANLVILGPHRAHPRFAKLLEI